jgi:Domain of unknown function (DUF4278)
MRLNFRGHSYEIPAPIQADSDSTDHSNLKLIYRGLTYNYIPRSTTVSEAVKPDEPTVSLIYRGNLYKRNFSFPNSLQQPRVINWRYQTSGES